SLVDVHRAVGSRQQSVCGGGIRGKRGRADRYRDSAGRVVRIAQRATNPARERYRAYLIHSRHQEDELIAAPPGDDVRFAQVSGKDRRHALQHGVAGRVTAGVIHLLERINVEHDHGERLGEWGTQPDFERLFEGASIRKPGQWVGPGRGGQALDQPRVGDRDGSLVRQDGQQPQVIAVVLMQADLDVDDDPDQVVLEDDRNGEHGLVGFGGARDVDRLRMALRVANQRPLFGFGYPAGDSLADLDG